MSAASHQPPTAEIDPADGGRLRLSGRWTLRYAADLAKALQAAPESVTHIDATGVLHVTEAGSEFYLLNHTPAEIDEAFKVFTHIAYVANRTDWIKARVTEPIRIEQEPAA